jgi:hypothetical protein
MTIHLSDPARDIFIDALTIYAESYDEEEATELPFTADYAKYADRDLVVEAVQENQIDYYFAQYCVSCWADELHDRGDEGTEKLAILSEVLAAMDEDDGNGPFIPVEVFDTKGASIDYQEAKVVDYHPQLDPDDERDKHDNYVLFAAGLKDGKTINVRVFRNDMLEMLREFDFLKRRAVREKKLTAYPCREAAKSEAFDLLQRVSNEAQRHILAHIGDSIIEAIGEYEHGTADVDAVEGVTMTQYAAVAMDLLRGFCNVNGPEPFSPEKAPEEPEDDDDWLTPGMVDVIEGICAGKEFTDEELREKGVKREILNREKTQ